MRRRSCVLATGLVASLFVSACATGPTNRFIQRSGSGPIEVEQKLQPKSRTPASPTRVPTQLPPIRALASNSVTTAEGTQPELRDGLSSLQRAPSAAAHLRVASAYAHAGVYDLAIEHFDRALGLDARLAGAYDGRARVWREWHLLAPALSDATRAVYYAPRSPEVRNTMGTVLLALSDRTAAAAAFRCALALDPTAAYALANLSRLGEVPEGIPPACGPALRKRRLAQ